jgi:hypothetical protein
MKHRRSRSTRRPSARPATRSAPQAPPRLGDATPPGRRASQTGYEALLTAALKGKGAMAGAGRWRVLRLRDRARRGVHGQRQSAASMAEPPAPAAGGLGAGQLSASLSRAARAREVAEGLDAVAFSPFWPPGAAFARRAVRSACRRQPQQIAEARRHLGESAARCGVKVAGFHCIGSNAPCPGVCTRPKPRSVSRNRRPGLVTASCHAPPPPARCATAPTSPPERDRGARGSRGAVGPPAFSAPHVGRGLELDVHALRPVLEEPAALRRRSA